MGRAARHIDGNVIMYADLVTTSMREAIEETHRRRRIQEAYNKEHGITPRGIKKAIRDITERVKAVAEAKAAYSPTPISREEVIRLIKDLEAQMRKAAKTLEFEQVARSRTP